MSRRQRGGKSRNPADTGTRPVERKNRPAQPQEPKPKEPLRLDVRGFLVLLATAAALGPFNFMLGIVLWLGPRELIFPGGQFGNPYETPLIIISQGLTAAATMTLAHYSIGRWSGLARGWGYILGFIMAVVTNPIVLLSVPVLS